MNGNRNYYRYNGVDYNHDNVTRYSISKQGYVRDSQSKDITKIKGLLSSLHC